MDRPLDINMVITQYVCLLFSLCVHEAAHALTADRCGDNTARFLGRVSLNPLAHIDLIGTVVLPLLMLTTGIPLIGWAKPVPVNPRNFRNMRRDNMLVSIAGPLSNLLLAILFAFILRISLMVAIGTQGAVGGMEGLVYVGIMMVTINLALMLFNLIPVPPLDGSHILYELVGSRGQRVMEQAGPWGILFLLFFGGRLLHGPLSALQGTMFHLITLGLR